MSLLDRVNEIHQELLERKELTEEQELAYIRELEGLQQAIAEQEKGQIH